METYTAVMPPQMPSCTVCGVTDVLRCAKCKAIYYCSSAHQQMHWPEHRQECRRLTREKSRIQELQQAVAATTLNNQMQFNSINNSQLPNGDAADAGAFTVADGYMNATNAINASHNVNNVNNTAAMQPTVTVMLGTNENEILNSQAETVAQHSSGSGYYGNIEANSTTMEQMQFRSNMELADDTGGGGGDGGGGGGSIDGGIVNNSINPDMFFMQDTNLQTMPQMPQFSSSHNNHLEKSTSYQIGRVDETLTGNVNERRYEELCRNIINDMNEYGLSVVDDFLGMEKGLEILNEVHRMYAAGVFKDGQLVNNFLPEQDLRTIRGDKIAWVKGVEPGCTNVGYLVNQIDAVICRANTMRNNGKLGNYNIKERTKAMVACYPGSGSHYVVHVDNPNKDGRVITAIYYLNVNWDAKRSGGVLRIFPEHGNTIADIEPKFDRLIFFWSDKRNPHEVQPAHRTRYAITVWYFDAYEREAALNRCKYHKSVAKTPTNTTTRATLTNITKSNLNTSLHTNNKKSSSSSLQQKSTAATIQNNANINNSQNQNQNQNLNTTNNINSNANIHNTNATTNVKTNFSKMASSHANTTTNVMVNTTNPNANSNSKSANEICT